MLASQWFVFPADTQVDEKSPHHLLKDRIWWIIKMTTSIYQAFPLEKGAHEIRLITLLEFGGENNSITRCKIFKADLDQSPTYTPLSYVGAAK
jgi:hypothetical protein